MNDEHDNSITDKEMLSKLQKPERVTRPKARYNPRREIRVKDAHRWKDQEDARYYAEEADISFRIPGHGQSQSIVISDEEVMELAIRCLTYLRDKAEGMSGP